ncbi:MAG: aminomethyl-transferring glycine dehydrogenase, partial [Leptospiraceae bacterium]|nr:aminomethyl-transferring glycine dehydrogenase [Leptospiraceae bacterium]
MASHTSNVSNQNLDIDSFINRHIGSSPEEMSEMLSFLGLKTLDELVDRTIPEGIRLKQILSLPDPKSEYDALGELESIISQNKIYRSYIGLGYNDCVTPAVIRRNIIENPSWYTAYTPYQAEISQGRMEALLNFQTMVTDLTGMEIANASLLDEATSCAEAMSMSYSMKDDSNGNKFFVSDECHPQTIDVIKTRSEPVGIEVVVGDWKKFSCSRDFFGMLLQYPVSNGEIYDYSGVSDNAHKNGILVTVTADLLSLTLLKPPAEFGADIAVGTTQRFGVPLGFGGPHAGYFATKDEFKRQMPGRLIGVSKDSSGKPALRLSLQTREQHIRRDKATSNICTAQVLLAVISSMYAVYHGPKGLRNIAYRIHRLTDSLASTLTSAGFSVENKFYFDTITVSLGKMGASEIVKIAEAKGINFRIVDKNRIAIALDETVNEERLSDIIAIFASNAKLVEVSGNRLPKELNRTSNFLTHPIFNSYHTETKLVRYIKRLELKDISLTTSMIPLGSCTMKLNAAAEMLPITWAEFANIHPFVPKDQAKGYLEVFKQLESFLSAITGFPAISLQPNAGSQGEYAGLLAIRDFHKSKNEIHRNVCLIPVSAHGTNPASAAMAGFRVVPVACDALGNIDVTDLKAKSEEHAKELAALMVTYPSTHGVFEESIMEICDTVHKHGGQVYMDGANMNAQVGLCRPADIGADVCHLNLHKTFAIPHGGGGPGVGPIGVAEHLRPFLPGHPLVDNGTGKKDRTVSAAPWGSAGVLPISWMYIRMTGSAGLKLATKMAILNANYVAKRLSDSYPLLYKGKNGLIAHECIMDFRMFKSSAKIEVEDVAKRLMDFGFHAPTMSFPVPGTLMIEPTESESKEELDRFCDALISIREEIRKIENGTLDEIDNPLKNSPHTAESVISENWNHKYSRELAAYPLPYLRANKFWPSVGRVDNVYGDRNLVCTC